MAKLTYDPNRIKLVDIETIIPNDWNPKDDDTEDYQKIKKSIETIGLEGTIKTRQYKGKNQVIDGMQRYKIAKELGINKLYIYDEGKLSDQRAREKTIWWQQQVPFNRIEEAFLVIKIRDYGEPIQLPYNELEIDQMRQLTTFDFSQYDKTQKEYEHNEKFSTLNIKMTKEQYDICMNAINKMKEINNCTDSQAIERICADYLSGV